MGFMDQFHQQPTFADRISQMQQMAGNNPRALIDQLAQSGMTVNLPDGRTVSVGELVKMVDGKTPEQALAMFGLK